MSVETELKLRIAPEHLERLKRHPLLRKLSTSRAATRKLYSVYYDTPALDLRQNAMALRLRRVGRQWLQTLKGGGKVQTGLHQRSEWETPVEGEALDFEALQAGGAPPLPPPLRKKLRPLFVTDFSRTSRMLSFEGATVELSMDSGAIRAGKASRPISELELELKSGEPVQLFKLALALLDIVPLEVEHTSKAEYGYRLFARSAPVITKADTPNLSTCPDVPCALQALTWSCLFHLQSNVPGVVQKLDEEYLHQVRVALRRLRVVLAMAEAFRPNGELSALNKQVAELGTELGRLREWDVFVTQTLAPVRAHLASSHDKQTASGDQTAPLFPHPQTGGEAAGLLRGRRVTKAELRNLLRAGEKQRARHHDIMVEKLQSQDYQRLLLRFGAWMHGDYWREAAANAPTVADFARQTLDKRSRQASKRGRHLATADAAQLHQLRIACKKLRYSAEMFASLFEPPVAKRYLPALTALQDILGALNDITVAHRLLNELDAGAQHSSTLLLHSQLERSRTDWIARLNNEWRRFSREKAFWKA